MRKPSTHQVLLIFSLVLFCLISLSISNSFGPTNSNRNSNDSLIIWSSDFHISPVADIKDLLKSHNVHIIDKSLSGHCHLKNTCETDLKVLTKANGIHLGNCPNQLMKQFYDAYSNDPEFAKVDAFLCNHASGMCEIFLPFNKPIIVIASTRYEIGRHTPERWKLWNENLERIASKPWNTVGANNLYDQEYMKFFTGLSSISLFPSYCNYITARYSYFDIPPSPSSPSSPSSLSSLSSSPSPLSSSLRSHSTSSSRPNPHRPEVLIAPSRGISPFLTRSLFEALRNYNSKSHPKLITGQQGQGKGQGQAQSFSFKRFQIDPSHPYSIHKTGPSLPPMTKTSVLPSSVQNTVCSSSSSSSSSFSLPPFRSIRDLYPSHFEYEDLAAHPAIVILPYQVSFMSLFEFYRMGIPLFAPSVSLLASWHTQHRVLSERTWPSVFGKPSSTSVLPRHSNASSLFSSDPNNEFSLSAIEDWVSLSDFYQWPHITYFDSFEDLFQSLCAVDLKETSRLMHEFNRLEGQRIHEMWENTLQKIRKHKTDRLSRVSDKKEVSPLPIQTALRQAYGIELSSECVGVQS